MLPQNVNAQIKTDSYEVPSIFNMLAKDGDIAREAMYNTFNMGIGMMIAINEADADKAASLINASGQTAYIVGEITEGEKGITLV